MSHRYVTSQATGALTPKCACRRASLSAHHAWQKHIKNNPGVLPLC